MVTARGRTTAVSSEVCRISERRTSGIRKPPSAGTVDPKLFWIFLVSIRLAASSSLLGSCSELCQMAWKNSAVSA